MSHVWQDQIQRWQRLAVWEAERLRSTPPDLSAAVAWMAQAWELAARCDPAWGSLAAAERHWHELAEVQRRLARARLGS